MLTRRLLDELDDRGPAARLAADARRFLRILRILTLSVGLPALRGVGKGSEGAARFGAGLRSAFEELGLTYLKLGQFLAMRFDLLPAEVCNELQKLFEGVQPMPYTEVERVIEAELGAPLARHYRAFVTQPVASASVAQVHEAVTHDGEHVAVKVQRPGIGLELASDTRNLLRIARMVDALGVLGHLSAHEVAEEFVMWTARELDFESEGRTADRLRANALPFEIVPTVRWDLSTRRVLTMEFVRGISLHDVTALLEAGGPELVEEHLPGIDVNASVHHFATACLNQLFVAGFFHGDPHPGNIIVRADDTVAFVDFGIFGELSPYHRERMLRMIEAVASGDLDGAFRCYADLCDPTDATDLDAFEREVKEILARWYAAVRDGGAVSERHLGKYIGQMMGVLRRHRLRADMDTLLFWRAMHALDSAAIKAPSHFDLISELRRFFENHRGGPVRRLRAVVADRDRQLAAARVQSGLPRQLRHLVRLAEGSLPWRPDEAETAEQLRRENRRARAVATALLGLSSVNLLRADGLGAGVSVAVACMATLCLVLAASQARVWWAWR